jgi:hypothetical protein
LPLATDAQRHPPKTFIFAWKKGSSLVLTADRCGMEEIVGTVWQHSEVHITGQPKVMTLEFGLLEAYRRQGLRHGRSPAVLDRPDGTGGKMFYQLDMQSCSFQVPGVSFEGWRNGNTIAVLKKKEDCPKARRISGWQRTERQLGASRAGKHPKL